MHTRFTSFVFLATWSIALFAYGDTVVLPPSLASAEANDNFAYNTPLTYQTLYGGSAVAGLPTGATITGMRFRLDGGQLTNPAVNVSNFDISIGKSTNSTLSTNFASNEAADTVLVRSGAYTFAAGSMPGGATPNAFGSLFSFTTPYVYTGGSLLLSFSSTKPSADLLFDFTDSTSGMQSAGQLTYNATTAISVEQGQGLPVQFVYSVPEPSFAMVAVSPLAFGLARRRCR